MLAKEENELVTRVGPGTPMGEVLRRYWLPALLSWELAEPDCPPVRLKILGERLVAFRDTSGRVGILDELCAHRCASLWLGRNEDNGLRCIYHGWKYDVDGNCVDQMNEPESFANRVHIKHYPAVERGDMIWIYMGPPELIPPEPDFEYLRVDAEHRTVTKVWEECSWLQALEGGVDTSHAPILHRSFAGGEGNLIDSPFVRSSAPTLELDMTDYGYRYYGVRELDEADRYVRGYHFVMPFTQIRPAQVGQGDRPPETIISGHHWVPMDDENCIVWNWSYSFGPTPLTERQRSQFGTGDGWDAVDRTGGFRSFANISNDYQMDREMQRSSNFSGIRGINTQDRAVQESMGIVVDRTQEHLGPADRAIVTTRRMLIDATRQVAAGEDPLGARATTYFKARAIDKIFRRSDEWRDTLIPAMNSMELPPTRPI